MGRTYLSRSPTGTVLYVTHHFTTAELSDLLTQSGFAQVTIHEVLFCIWFFKDDVKDHVANVLLVCC